MASKKILLEKFSGFWPLFLALGILFMLLGFVVIIFPVAGTFAIETLLGLVLMVAGLTQVVIAFQTRKWTGFIPLLMLGLVLLVAAFLLLAYPLASVVAITLFLGLLLLLIGIVKLFLGIALKEMQNSGWIVFDGAITLLLGILVVLAWPSDSVWVVGLLFGINMLFGGISNIVIALAMKEAK